MTLDQWASRTLRPPLSMVLWPWVRPFRRWIERSRDSRRLAPGITAVVVARNEGYTLPLCLRSLIGFADQVVCVDNGSVDDTLAKMRGFQQANDGCIEVEVLSMPNRLLGDCREAGLKATRHQWHLRWDADMVAATSGAQNILELRRRALADDRHRAIQLPRTNLYGDLQHTYKLGDVVDPGEPILIRFGRGIRYREFGKFDTVRLPLHYEQCHESKRYYFHLAGLKADTNLIHRFHYFAWREAVNAARARQLPSELADFDEFKRRRNEELFGTNDSPSLKFRFQRQLVYHLTRFDPSRHGEYPQILAEEIARRPRFQVVYREGRPYARIDHEDVEMTGYQPTPADLRWDPEHFLRRFLSEQECTVLGIRVLGEAASA